MFPVPRKFTMPSRRRFLLAACAASLALGLSPVAEGSAAVVHSRSASVVQRAALPGIGVEVPTTMTAVDVPLEVDGVLVKVNLQGRMRQRTEALPGESPNQAVRLRTIAFHLEGETADGGLRVMFDLDGADASPASTLRVRSNFPPSLEETDVVALVATIRRAGQPEIALHSVHPAVLTATLSVFPPRGDDYQLENPVDFVVPGTATPVARLLALPARRGGNVLSPQ
ncbi:hypothetical protein [Streptomyces sp. NRRL S-241]|uniref:hypothetical protein n=1 Tax=Streptomyces sp. NRRL S-241 TaxID=1463896 RepID=UPI0004C0FAA7|nr:hypothetical protein [Streptomyces sp. NRRL S-241]